MITSAEGKAIIKQFEGLELSTYRDVKGVPTIGYGHTGPDVVMGQTITKDQAEALLTQDLLKFENYVNHYVTAPLNQGQFDALVSFTYNLGPGALQTSTLLKKVNANPHDPSIKDEFKKWKYAGGRVINGLVKRRAMEAEIYFGLKKKLISLLALTAVGGLLLYLWMKTK